MDLIQKANKLGYKHYTEFTMEELDNLSLGNSNKQIEYYFIQRWLREEHSLYVMLEETETLSLKSGIGFYYKIIKVKDKEHLGLDCSMYFYKTYEEALEAGLKEGLRLI